MHSRIFTVWICCCYCANLLSNSQYDPMAPLTSSTLPVVKMLQIQMKPTSAPGVSFFSLQNITTIINLGEHRHKSHYALFLCSSGIIRCPEIHSHTSSPGNTSPYGSAHGLVWLCLLFSPISEILPLCLLTHMIL